MKFLSIILTLTYLPVANVRAEEPELTSVSDGPLLRGSDSTKWFKGQSSVSAVNEEMVAGSEIPPFKKHWRDHCRAEGATCASDYHCCENGIYPRLCSPGSRKCQKCYNYGDYCKDDIECCDDLLCHGDGTCG